MSAVLGERTPLALADVCGVQKRLAVPDDVEAPRSREEKYERDDEYEEKRRKRDEGVERERHSAYSITGRHTRGYADIFQVFRIPQ